jgi:ABC-type nitrate/sulfonate/bicarbonate transport system substrate-binding protein
MDPNQVLRAPYGRTHMRCPHLHSAARRTRAVRGPAPIVAALAVALVLAAATSCSTPLQAPLAQAVTVASPALEQAALIYIAADQGFFAQQGLNVTVHDTDSGVAALDAVVKGEADIAEAVEYPVVRLALQGQPVVIIATNDQFENDYVVARPDRGIRTLADLKGKRVGLARGTIVEFYLARLLELLGIPMDAITIVDVKPDHFVEVMARGEVDAVVAWQPYVAQIEKQVEDAVVLPAQSSQAAFGVLASRRQWITDHPDTVERFLKALHQAEDYLIRYPGEGQAIVQRRLNYDPAYLAGVWPQHEPALSLDQPLIIAMKDEARWLMRNHMAVDDALPDLGAYIYTPALEAVKPGAVSLVR